MATAAELKARLAKYVKKDPAPSAPIAATATPTASESQQPPAEPVVPVALVAPTVLPAQQLVVNTDVQSTDVVVLERTHEQRDAVGTKSDETPIVSTNLDVTNPVHQDFLQRLADLETALLIRDPLMKTHLGVIHKTMISHEEIANLLTVEEISKIMSAQQAHTSIVLRAETVNKSKAAATKKANQLSINDV